MFVLVATQKPDGTVTVRAFPDFNEASEFLRLVDRTEYIHAGIFKMEYAW